MHRRTEKPTQPAAAEQAKPSRAKPAKANRPGTAKARATRKATKTRGTAGQGWARPAAVAAGLAIIALAVLPSPAAWTAPALTQQDPPPGQPAGEPGATALPPLRPPSARPPSLLPATPHTADAQRRALPRHPAAHAAANPFPQPPAAGTRLAEAPPAATPSARMATDQPDPAASAGDPAGLPLTLQHATASAHAGPRPPHAISALLRSGAPLPPARPLAAAWHTRQPRPAPLPEDALALKQALDSQVANVAHPSRTQERAVADRAAAMLAATQHAIDASQIVLVVDRNPAVERLYVVLADPAGPAAWHVLGDVHVSTGQAGRKDYYITPIGVFAHTDAILDFRAQGTYNEHHVRGLGVAGMRVWDFGWQWAVKGWHTDGEGGDIRLQMHATDPKLLEYRLGHPASEGCVRVSSTMNKFLDHYGVLDADYEVAAVEDPRYAALLSPDRTPTKLAGRYLIVIDSSLPQDTPPTQASRPADWPPPQTPAMPSPDLPAHDAQPATPNAPGTDTNAAGAGTE